MRERILKNRKAIFIIGPTASGKTEVAHFIAEKYKFKSIISVDSMQIYQYMDIGTSKPDIEERKRFNYYGIDIISPAQYFSTGDYLRYIKNILKSKPISEPLLFVGGTGLYYDALVKGLDDIPPKDEKVRIELENEVIKNGIEKLYEKLKEIDPLYASKITSHDKRKIIRALEVYYITKKPFSEFHSIKKENTHKYKNILRIGLNLDRNILYKRINERVDQMIEKGFIKEARKIYEIIDDKDLPSAKAIGYAQLFQYFKKEIELGKAIQLIKRSTRKFAKRQITWFKRDKEIIWINFSNKNELFQKIDLIIKEFLNNK